MSREYLFRGKTYPKEQGVAFNNVWVEGDLVVSRDKYYIHPRANAFEVEKELSKLVIMHEVIPQSVGEYVGLKDKNGKKIFEGDVIKIYWKDNVLTMGDIEYDETKCRYVVCEDFAFPYGFDNTTPFEVIGNIIDNKKLLGE